MIFIVHASFDARGQIRGVVTHAQTGRKEQFADTARLGHLIAAMAGPPEARVKNGLEKLDADADRETR